MPEFLPISKKDMDARGWTQCDFVYIIGDAYVDHPSFGHAIISRVLEDAGYKVGILSQPDWRDPASVTALGEPRLGFLVSGGNMDSMVNHGQPLFRLEKAPSDRRLHARRRDGKAAGLCRDRLLQPHPPDL